MSKQTRKTLLGACILICLAWSNPNPCHAQQMGAGSDGGSPPQTASPAAGARQLTLPEAVAMALRNNRDVLLAQTAVAQADAEFREARSVFRPQVVLGSGLAATAGFPLSIEGSAPSIFTVASSQALLNGNLKNLAKQAGQMRLASEKSLEEKRDDIVAQTVSTYLDLDRNRRSLEYVSRHAQNLLAAERIMGERVAAGLEPPLQATRAKLNSARARSRVVAMENQIAMLELSLRDLTGIPQSEAILTEPAEVPALSPDETEERLLARAIENNQGIQALEEQIRAREFQVKSQQSLRWPRINLVGQYGLFSDINNFSQYFQKFSRNNATLGFSVQVPIYQGDTLSAGIAKAQAELAAARYRRDQGRAAVAAGIRQMWNEVQQQSSGQEVAKLELEVARRSLDAVLAQYEEGRVNRLAVEEARSQEDESWVNFFQAGYLAEKARLELLRLSGEIRTVFQ